MLFRSNEQQGFSFVLLIHSQELWRQWIGPRGKPYKNFSAYCVDIEMTYETCLTRKKLAEDSRFHLLRHVDIPMAFTSRLYKLAQDDPLFEIAAALKDIGCSCHQIEAMLSSPNPIEQARMLALKKFSSNHAQQRNLQHLLQLNADESPPPSRKTKHGRS